MKKLFTILLLLITTALFGQHFQIGLGIGAATCQMNSLKDLNEALIETIPFEAQICDNFKPWLMFGLSSTYTFKNPRLKAGLQYYFNSSGSRVCSNDYSGEIYTNQVINGHSLAAGFWYELLQKNKLSFNVGLESGTTFSILNIEEGTIIYDVDEYTEAIKFHSIGFFVIPELELMYPTRRVNLGLKTGWNFSFNGDMIYGHKQGKLRNPNTRENIQADWSGLRLLVSIYYPLKKRTKE